MTLLLSQTTPAAPIALAPLRVCCDRCLQRARDLEVELTDPRYGISTPPRATR